jgi:hypothetical protein
MSQVLAGRSRLRHRLGAADIRTRVGAFCELLWHRHLLQRGWNFTYPGRLPNGRTPDFLVTAPASMLLEVCAVFDDVDVAVDDQRVQALLDELRTVGPTRPWSVSVIDKMPRLTDQERSQARGDFAAAQTMGSTVRVGPVVIEPLEGDPVAPGFPVVTSARYLTPEERVVAALERKLSRYTLQVVGNRPLVVAICAGDPSVHLEAVLDALYGRGKLQLDHDQASGGWRTAAVVRPGRYITPADHRHLSAVIALQASLWRQAGVECHVLRNPFAIHPIPAHLFDPWPRTECVVGPDHEARFQRVDGDPKMAV